MGPEGPHVTNTEAFKIEYRSFQSNDRSLQNREEKAARIQRMGPGGLHDTSTEAFKIEEAERIEKKGARRASGNQYRSLQTRIQKLSK